MQKTLFPYLDNFKINKSIIVEQWITQEIVLSILEKHHVNIKLFRDIYASGVFDYFMNLIEGSDSFQGNCPVMLELLEYLKDYNIHANELFSVCTNFKKAMLDFTYDASFNTKEVFNAITFLFDNNFNGLLQRYTETIYLAQKEVEKASRAREYFLSNMSHEIRTPLNAILGFVRILKDEKNSKEHQKYLDIIENSSESLMNIINDILDFSKLRSGEFSIDERPFNIHEELAYTLELFVANVKEKSLTLQSFIDPEIPFEIVVDGLRIKQILSNFLSNAIKFTPKEGDIKVRVECKNSLLTISVEDNGIGLSAKSQENIFNAFTQVNDSDQLSEGTGLGLAICSNLAKLMSGTVFVKSKLGRGSTFTLELPIQISSTTMHQHYDVSLFQRLTIGLLQSSENVDKKVIFLRDYWKSFQLHIVDVYELDEDAYDLLFFIDSEIDDIMRDKLIKERTPSIALMKFIDNSYDNAKQITPLYFPLYCSKLYEGFLEALHLSPSTDSDIIEKPAQSYYDAHVLVAEDNDANQELIKTILEKFGISYYIASDGIEAFQTFTLSHFDMIIMDEQMPNQSGSETTEMILHYEAQQNLKHTPIIALTANALKGVKEHCMEIGYDGFLTKPINLKALNEVFAQYLQVNVNQKIDKSQDTSDVIIHGIDTQKLILELQLESSDLEYLIQTFVIKSKKVMGELKEAIEQNNYENIEKLAHSLKGSSANFRLTRIQELSSKIEQVSRRRETFEYAQVLEEIEQLLSKIYIE